MNDEEFWDLVDRYESKDISKEDAIKEICKYAKTYEVAMADLELLVKRTITKDEKEMVKELLDAKNIRRSSRLNKQKRA